MKADSDDEWITLLGLPYMDILRGSVLDPGGGADLEGGPKSDGGHPGVGARGLQTFSGARSGAQNFTALNPRQQSCRGLGSNGPPGHDASGD